MRHKMEALVALIFLLPTVVFCQHEGVLDIQVPSIRVLSQERGNISLQSGVGGNVHLRQGRNGSIFFEDVDLLEIIEIVKSLPPLWPEHGSSDNLGIFRSGTQLKYQMNAEDPEGGNITYQVVAGSLPPGVALSTSGELTGVLPETDSVYRFTVRAVDTHGKFSDLSFKLEIRANKPCIPNPCKNAGSCTPLKLGEHQCHCVLPYGGRNCEFDCDKNPLGLTAKTRLIPDALMSAHNSYSTSLASAGRIGDPKGWVGADNTSWLQVDLGGTFAVHAVAQQSVNAQSYTSVFYMLYSSGGNIFTTYTGTDGQPYPLAGTATTAIQTTSLPESITARFVRFVPVTSSPRPLFRLELYGCPA